MGLYFDRQRFGYDSLSLLEFSNRFDRKLCLEYIVIEHRMTLVPAI